MLLPEKTTFSFCGLVPSNSSESHPDSTRSSGYQALLTLPLGSP